MITAKGLTKYYGDKCAVEDLDFHIDSGQIIGILGLNGAGKTTTLRILSSLLLPSTGKVTIDGIDVVEQPHEIRKKVGFLPEEPPLYLEMSVEAYLVFAGGLRGLNRATARRRVEQVMELTNLSDMRGEVIDNLSFGYRKRVGIAQAIVHDPQVLILDEPITGLDPVQIVEMRRMIRDLGGKHTVLVSSHILPEISQTCDHLLMIQAGRLVASGTEEELIGQLIGGHKIKLQISGDVEQAQALLSGLERVSECQLMETLGARQEGQPYRTAASFFLQLSTDGDIREQLSRELVQAGFGLLHLGPAEAELESIFLQLTQDKEVSR